MTEEYTKSKFNMTTIVVYQNEKGDVSLHVPPSGCKYDLEDIDDATAMVATTLRALYEDVNFPKWLGQVVKQVSEVSEEKRKEIIDADAE